MTQLHDASKFASKYGQWAFVAGASGGIGACIARELAQRGMNVAIAARRQEKLEEVAAGIRKDFGVKTRTVRIDLLDPQRVEIIDAALSGLDVGAFVYSAADGYAGSFLQRSLDDYRRDIELNDIALLELTYYFTKRFCTQKRGAMVFLGSNAGVCAVPGMSVYAATKGFELQLATSLWAELAPYNVDVLCSIISGTETDGIRRLIEPNALEQQRKDGAIQTPEEVAAETIEALGAEPTVITGKKNRTGMSMMRKLMNLNKAIKVGGEGAVKANFQGKMPGQFGETL